MKQRLKLTFYAMMLTVFLQCQKSVYYCFPLETHCIFDDIQSEVVSTSPVMYKTARDKRSTEDLYQPIRIKANIEDPEEVVDTSDVERLKTIVNGAISIIHNILLVTPVVGPLLMTRSEACQPFSTGINTGKCAVKSKGYRGERCFGDLDNFVIPDEHLEGLWQWNETHPEPINQLYSNGSGLADTDTVLYVKAEHTGQCGLGQVAAYAAYCKVDQNNRPIAGIINFCPEHLQDDLFDESKFILLAVHEIFHVLGFSSSLFSKFKVCTETTNDHECTSGLCPAVDDSHGQPRLVTPSVIVQAQKHFGCQETCFGGPLEKTSDGYSSHWATSMMFGSIMAPVVDQPHRTFLDNLTLAVFEDSGWYKVNFDYGEEILWGKNQGCEFGMQPGCQSPFFCNHSCSGCHYVHEDKATCSIINEGDQCQIMKASQQCSVPGNGSISVNGEVFQENSRCFVSNLVIKESIPCDLRGACYLTRCDNQSISYEVKVGNAEWQPCPQNTSITIVGYLGSVRCPSAEVICRQATSILDLVDTVCQDCLMTTHATTSITESFSSCNNSTAIIEDNLCISLEFEAVDTSILAAGNELLAFSQALIRTICDTTSIHKSRICQLDVTEGRDFNTINVTFYITQEFQEGNDIPAHVAYFDLQEAINSNRLQVEYSNIKYTAITIRILSGFLPSTVTPTVIATSVEFHTAVIALGVCVLVFILICVTGCVCHRMKNITNAIKPSDFESNGIVLADQQAPRVANNYKVKDWTVTEL
ncbi:ciliated left-right organizer metallopeptidase-like [Asterias amurensis]|uniref:ciliated left-right organizer metallopeptidase-like n=1 Tax=Asterias amurensis TaxID=7602 RepID=UPI003AB27D84